MPQTRLRAVRGVSRRGEVRRSGARSLRYFFRHSLVLLYIYGVWRFFTFNFMIGANEHEPQGNAHGGWMTDTRDDRHLTCRLRSAHLTSVGVSGCAHKAAAGARREPGPGLRYTGHTETDGHIQDTYRTHRYVHTDTNARTHGHTNTYQHTIYDADMFVCTQTGGRSEQHARPTDTVDTHTRTYRTHTFNACRRVPQRPESAITPAGRSSSSLRAQPTALPFLHRPTDIHIHRHTFKHGFYTYTPHTHI
jgi:hypothetical protein